MSLDGADAALSTFFALDRGCNRAFFAMELGVELRFLICAAGRVSVLGS